MPETPVSIGVILSSQEMSTTINRLAKSRLFKVQTALVIGIDEAIPVGKEMEKNGSNVLISRRATAERLRENVSIPVLTLMANPLDILISIKQAVQFGKKILITCFRRPISGVEILEDIFNARILKGIYHDSASLKQIIVSAKEKGVEVIVGGGLSCHFARQTGLHGVELYISDEAVSFALEDALSVAKLHQVELEKSIRYQCIIDSYADIILAVNRVGAITSANKNARNLFQLAGGQTHSDALNEFLSALNFKSIFETKEPQINKLKVFKDEKYITSAFPVIVNHDVAGLVAILRHLPAEPKDENEGGRTLAKGLVAKYTIDDMIHVSKIMKDLVKKIKRYAASDSTVLITGETGTGKEILAQSIHNLGSRIKGPFVSINCAALPDQLLENELFGHEEGAFTGARKKGKTGLFELAHNGTIFLDEISSTQPAVQASLLRVLQEKKVMRIGGDRLIPVDVRVLAASNKNLAAVVRTGQFREDLFFRLNVLSLWVPPLRERLEDLPYIVRGLIRRNAEKYGIPEITIPELYLQQLMVFPWPGNIRQLENFIERLLLISEGEFNVPVFNELLGEMESHTPSLERQWHENPSFPEPGSLGRIDEKVINDVLIAAKFSKTKAARMMGISRTTLWRKIKNMG